MPLGDVTYVDAALDAVVASWPSSGAKYRLYVSDPALEAVPSDVELTAAGGYAAVAFSPAGWDAAADGGKTTTTPVTFPTATDAYSDVATYWAIVDSGGLIVFSDALDDPIVGVSAGTVAAFSPSLSFVDGA